MILIDTGPLVALCDARDALHERAVQDLERLSGGAFATCEAVITEAAFHLSASSQRFRLKALLDEMVVSILPVATDHRTREKAWSWMLAYADHYPDWADGCLVVLCGMDPAARVWTYDREFRTIWRMSKGQPVPLALL